MRPLLVPHLGVGTGMGHLERMLALGDALGVCADLAVPPGLPWASSRVAARGHHAVVVAGDVGARALAAAHRIHTIVVVDAYEVPVVVQTELRMGGARPLVMVDDLNGAVDCDLSVNPSGAAAMATPSGATWHLPSPRHAMLSNTYLQARDRAHSWGGAPKSVLVATGASALDGLIWHLVDALLDGGRGVQVSVVIGPDMVESAVRTGVSVLRQPDSLLQPLLAHQVFVGAAGTTALQAACLGRPMVLIPAVGNQIPQARALAEAGAAVVVGDANVATAASAARALLGDPQQRRSMAAAGMRWIDGQGTLRVAQAVRQLVGAHV